MPVPVELNAVTLKSPMTTFPASDRRQIKSRERVRAIAEVYTRDEEINAMLDLVGDVSYNIEARFLEPSAGNGNFLVQILDRKLASALGKAKMPGNRRGFIQKEFEFYALMAFTSLYAVDIDPDNVEEAQERLCARLKEVYSRQLNTYKPSAGFYDSVRYVLRLNIQLGDMLQGTDTLCFTEFSAPRPYKFTQRIFRFADLLASDIPPGGLFAARKPLPIAEISMKNYWELADV
jgi:hypothetical protein